MARLLYGKKRQSFFISSVVLIQWMGVTDGRTDDRFCVAHITPCRASSAKMVAVSCVLTICSHHDDLWTLFYDFRRIRSIFQLSYCRFLIVVINTFFDVYHRHVHRGVEDHDPLKICRLSHPMFDPRKVLYLGFLCQFSYVSYGVFCQRKFV